jgi:ribonuclease D
MSDTGQAYEIVAEQDHFEEVCRLLGEQPAIGIDTEFVRERTFFPHVGLIQVSSRDAIYLIDPLAIDDATALKGVLESESTVKIFHSCTEDLESLHYHCGAKTRSVFDTQVGAAFCGYGYQIGYQALVERVFGIAIAKEQTRSNWLKRPLSDAQLVYAAQDVRHLIPLWSHMTRELHQMGRLEWACEDCCQNAQPERYVADPDSYYLKFKIARQLSPRNLAVLRNVCAWRERESMRRDLPRARILSDKNLRLVVRNKPRSLRELAKLNIMRPAEIKRSGKELIKVVDRSVNMPKEDLPDGPRRYPHFRGINARVDSLREVVAETAEQMGLPAELVACRRTLVDLSRNHLMNRLDPIPPSLAGWRRETIAEKLLGRLASFDPETEVEDADAELDDILGES